MQLPFTSLVSSAYLKLGVAVALIAGLGYCVWAIRDSGVQATEQKHKAALAEHIERAAAQAYQISLQDAEVISWADNARTKTVFKTLWRDHETVAYADCSLSPAGRVLWNRASAAATDLSDTIEQGESYQVVTKAGNWDAEGNSGSPSPAHGADAPAGDRPGSSSPNVGSAWVVGGGY